MSDKTEQHKRAREKQTADLMFASITLERAINAALIDILTCPGFDKKQLGQSLCLAIAAVTDDLSRLKDVASALVGITPDVMAEWHENKDGIAKTMDLLIAPAGGTS